jgi:hypothetical protein
VEGRFRFLSPTSATPNSQFDSVTDAYIGIAFPINTVNHYGWIRVDIENSTGTFLVKDWAYEMTPGVGIAAGDTGSLAVIPEASSLALLTAGAAGVAAMRRRRRA